MCVSRTKLPPGSVLYLPTTKFEFGSFPVITNGPFVLVKIASEWVWLNQVVKVGVVIIGMLGIANDVAVPEIPPATKVLMPVAKPLVIANPRLNPFVSHKRSAKDVII